MKSTLVEFDSLHNYLELLIGKTVYVTNDEHFEVIEQTIEGFEYKKRPDSKSCDLFITLNPGQIRVKEEEMANMTWEPYRSRTIHLDYEEARNYLVEKGQKLLGKAKTL